MEVSGTTGNIYDNQIQYRQVIDDLRPFEAQQAKEDIFQDRGSGPNSIEKQPRESLSKSEIPDYLSDINENLANVTQLEKSFEKAKEITIQLEDSLRRFEQATNFQEKDFLRNEVNKNIDDLINVARNTTYNGDKILSPETDYNEQTTQFSVKNQNNEYETLETPTLNQLKPEIYNIYPGNPNEDINIRNLTDKVSEFREGIEVLPDSLKDVRDRVLEEQRDFSNKKTNEIQTDTNSRNLNEYVKNIDFGKESSDFNKGNITALSGSVITAQANIEQNTVIRLLKS